MEADKLTPVLCKLALEDDMLALMDGKLVQVLYKLVLEGGKLVQEVDKLALVEVEHI